MSLARTIIAGCLGFFALACAGMGEEFNTSFCQEYGVSYINSCTESCGLLETDPVTCASHCQQSLIEDEIYKSSCSSATEEPQDGWPGEYKQNFMNACVEEGAGVEICTCMAEYVEQRMTINEMLALEARMVITDEAPPILKEAADACVPFP